jgi:putative phosphoesterase
MKRIGLLSDTHGYLDPKIWSYFADVDEVWHAGDIGDMATLEALEKNKILRIVYGNIDDHLVRSATKEFLRFKIEDVEVLMTHIGGKPGKYARPALEELQANGAPQLFVCGHSHIALAQFDQRFNMLWLNPGACGYKGFHQVKTIFRFSIECIELGPRIGNFTEASF